MLVYLAGSSVSVLENTLVEKEQLASEVLYDVEPRPRILFEFALSGVATDKLESVETRVIELLKETAAKDLDMVYLKECIQREKRQKRLVAEESPSTLR